MAGTALKKEDAGGGTLTGTVAHTENLLRSGEKDEIGDRPGGR